jgi:acetylornithine deacetylase
MPVQTRTADLLSQLIGFDTTSRNSNLEFIEFVRTMLEPHGIATELTFDDNRKKANLFATLGGDGRPGIVLSGHTDVVPVDGQSWSTNPFEAEIKGQKMFGRGTCDMKGFIAICLSKIEEILEADLATPIHFAFSYDEEVGCVGVTGLLDSLQKKPVLPRACIIGEPTSMGVVRAHKGMLFKHCCVRGKSAHSSLVDQGVNAVTVAAKIIAFADSIQQRIQAEGPFDPEFDPPYTTLHSGVIHGGTVNNIIPSDCQFDFEIRNLPDQPTLPLFEEVETYVSSELIPAMHAVSTDTGVDWETLAEYPGMNTPLDDSLIPMVSQLLNTTSVPGKVSYGTEGGHFQNSGIPTIICGPGSIEQAHKPDEFIDLDQLVKGEQFVSALIGSLR